jgi:hypothetical protein
MSDNLDGTTDIVLPWEHGVITVKPGGAMMSSSFRLADGRVVAPMQVSRTPDSGRIFLRGEWPCVPFGRARDLPGISECPDWFAACNEALLRGDREEGPQHGVATGGIWEVLDDGAASGTMSLAFEIAEGPIASLTRTITPDPDAPGVDITLTVSPRADCRLCVGLHPTLARAARIVPLARPRYFASLPGHLEDDTGRADYSFEAAPGQRFSSLEAVPAAGGGPTLDLSRLPCTGRSENLIQLVGVQPDGRGIDGTTGVALENSELGCTTTVRWHPDDFPSCQLWMSNRGRPGKPFGGNHVALGIEPVCGCWDLGPTVGAGDNPIAADGVPTAVDFRAGQPWQAAYRIECEVLAPERAAT